MVYRHNSYVTQKTPYRRMHNKIRIVKLSKSPLSMADRGKEKKRLLARTKRISVI